MYMTLKWFMTLLHQAGGSNVLEIPPVQTVRVLYHAFHYELHDGLGNKMHPQSVIDICQCTGNKGTDAGILPLPTQLAY